MNDTRTPLHLILLLLAMSGLNALQAQEASDAPKVPDHQKEMHEETLRLMASSKPEDRVMAAARLAGMYNEMNYALVWKLMHDKNPDVRLASISALTQFTCTMQYHLSFELARKMAEMLEKEVTPERIAAAHDAAAQADMQPEVKIRQIRMLTHSGRALIWLHGEHSLKSPRKNFAWYDAMGLTLFHVMVHHLDDAAGTYDDLIYELMLYQINEPEEMARALHLALQNLKLADITVKRQVTALDAFWNSGLLGENKPMNLVLLKELNPVWEPVKAHILSHIKEASDEERAAYYVMRIDEAYAEARKSLAPQSAQSMENEKSIRP